MCSLVVQPHNAPQSARGSRHDSSTGLETFAAITSAEKDDHAAIYNTRVLLIYKYVSIVTVTYIIIL